MGWGAIARHVLLVTLLANLGKMFPLLVYRGEATVRERLALCIGMWPRGEVGAGVLVLSLGYGIGGLMITVAVLSLAREPGAHRRLHRPGQAPAQACVCDASS